MAKRVFLLTGAGGFVGANLCRRLLSLGESDVHLFVKPTTRLWRLDDVLDKLHIHHVDLCDAAAIAEHVNAIHPSVVYHLATRGAYASQNDGDSILLVNVFGLWNLFNACSKNGCELFVNTGSSSEYGRKEFAMRETDILEPDSYYAVAKSAQSLLARLCSRMDDIPLVTLRLFSAYGPYEEPTRLIPKLMMATIFDEPIKMVNPRTARDFVYVDDIVDVYMDIEGLSKLRGEILNVGTGAQSSLEDVVQTTESILGRKIKNLAWGEMPPRAWDTDVWVADVSKLRRTTGAYPKTTLREGLVKCVKWFEEHGELYRGEHALPC
jgi:nucleoside-diphosphate-sugar epimerase